MNVKKLHFSFPVSELHLKSFLGSSRKPSTPVQPGRHINPRYRAYGKARIDMAQHIQNQQDWDTHWKAPKNSFAITFPRDGSWKQSIEYQVDDYAAEVGFWVDIVGIPVNAFGPDYAQFTGPKGEFTFAVTSTPEGLKSTPPESIRIQFLVDDINLIVDELSSRSVPFDQPPTPVSPGSSTHIATFLTPHGIAIDLWGECLANKPSDFGEQNLEMPGLVEKESQSYEPISDHLPFTPPDKEIPTSNLPYPKSDIDPKGDIGIHWKIFEDPSSYHTFTDYDSDKDKPVEQARIPVKSPQISQPVKNISEKLIEPESLPIVPKAKPEKQSEEEFVEEITYEPVDEIIPDLMAFPQKPETKHKPL